MDLWQNGAGTLACQWKLFQDTEDFPIFKQIKKISNMKKPWIYETNYRGAVLVLLSGFCTSISPILIKIGLSAALDPITLLTLRMIVAAIMLWIVFSMFFRNMLEIDRRELICCGFVAFFNCGASLSFIFALVRVEASIVTVVFSCYPAIVLILLSFRGEHFTRLKCIRLVLMIVGVYIVVGPGGQVNLTGVWFAIVPAVLYALYLVFIQWLLWNCRPQTAALYVVTFMALIMMAVHFFQPNRWALPSVTGWTVTLVLGVISTALARLAIFGGVHKIGSAQTALLSPLETLLTLLLAIFILKEKLSLLQWVGALFMIVSTVLILKQRKEKEIPCLLSSSNVPLTIK